MSHAIRLPRPHAVWTTPARRPRRARLPGAPSMSMTVGLARRARLRCASGSGRRSATSTAAAGTRSTRCATCGSMPGTARAGASRHETRDLPRGGRRAAHGRSRSPGWTATGPVPRRCASRSGAAGSTTGGRPGTSPTWAWSSKAPRRPPFIDERDTLPGHRRGAHRSASRRRDRDRATRGGRVPHRRCSRSASAWPARRCPGSRSTPTGCPTAPWTCCITRSCSPTPATTWSSTRSTRCAVAYANGPRFAGIDGIELLGSQVRAIDGPRQHRRRPGAATTSRLPDVGLRYELTWTVAPDRLALDVVRTAERDSGAPSPAPGSCRSMPRPPSPVFNRTPRPAGRDRAGDGTGAAPRPGLRQPARSTTSGRCPAARRCLPAPAGHDAGGQGGRATRARSGNGSSPAGRARGLRRSSGSHIRRSRRCARIRPPSSGRRSNAPRRPGSRSDWTRRRCPTTTPPSTPRSAWTTGRISPWPSAMRCRACRRWAW